MKVYLVRHGQSLWQVDRAGGDWNSPLTELGRQQANRLSGWLGSAPLLDNGARLEIAALVSSPYIRAQQTAHRIRRGLRLSEFNDDDLREADFLVSEHLPTRDSPGAPPPQLKLSPSYAALKDQANRALIGLCDRAEEAGGPVLAVSHGGLMSTILRSAAGSDSVSFWIYNATINLIEWKRGRWHLVYLNLWDHLPPNMRTY